MAGLLSVVLYHGGIHGGDFIWGLAASIVPGAITFEPFHAMRAPRLPSISLLLTVPTLEWLFAPDGQEQRVPGENRDSEIFQYHIPRLPVGCSSLVVTLTAGGPSVSRPSFAVRDRKCAMFFDAAYKKFTMRRSHNGQDQFIL